MLTEENLVYDRQWTWLFVKAELTEGQKNRLKVMGGCATEKEKFGRLGLWFYFKHHRPLSDFDWMLPKEEKEEDVKAVVEAGKVKPFSRPVRMEMPLVHDLGQATVRSMLVLAEAFPNEVSVKETTGIAQHQGKVYVRFRIDAPVRFEGRIYRKASTMQPVEKEHSSALLKWKVSDIHPMQNLMELATEHTIALEKHPDLCTRADRLYAQLSDALPAEALLGNRAEKLWLTIYNALSTKKASFKPHLYSNQIAATAGKVFGIEHWTDLKDKDYDEHVAECPRGKDLTATAKYRLFTAGAPNPVEQAQKAALITAQDKIVAGKAAVARQDQMGLAAGVFKEYNILAYENRLELELETGRYATARRAVAKVLDLGTLHVATARLEAALRVPDRSRKLKLLEMAIKRLTV